MCAGALGAGMVEQAVQAGSKVSSRRRVPTCTTPHQMGAQGALLASRDDDRLYHQEAIAVDVSDTVGEPRSAAVMKRDAEHVLFTDLFQLLCLPAKDVVTLSPRL